MINQIKLSLFLVFLFAIHFSALANVSLDGVLPSTEWQKAALEKDIVARLERRLDPIIRNKQYLIDVNISTSIPQKPDFKLAPSKPPENIKFSNVSPEKSNGDYIVFSKFGLEVPIIAAQEDKSASNQKSEFEYLWKYNQSVDVYQNLESVKVSVSLSEKLAETSRIKLKEILENTDLGIGETKPAFEFKYINFALDPVVEVKKKKEEPKEKSLWEKVEQFSNAIGLLLATVLMGIIAMLLMKQYENMKKDEQKAQAAPAQMMNQEKEEKEKDPAQPGSMMPGNTDNLNETSGFERFTAYLEKNPNGAYYLIRKWIKSDGLHEKKALFGLVKALDNKTLMSVFENISLQDREKWKTIISEKDAYISNIKEVDQYISKQVVEEIIVPATVEDNDLLEILMDISDESAAKYIQKNKNLGPYFVQLLSVKHTGMIFKYLDQGMIKFLLKESSKLKKEDVLGKVDELKKTLPEFTSKGADNSFITKIIELIPFAPVSGDEALFEALREAGAGKSVQKLAKNYYPSFLIKALPENILNSFLASYRSDKKTELLYSLDEDDKLTFMNSLGPEGSTVKEMIKMELENIESNIKLAKDIQNRSTEIWEEFVIHARKQISGNFDTQNDYSEALDQWIESAPRKPDLSVVA